jgi:mannose-6-phosphate isomerase-like protein (cupin superfamily)
MSWQVEAAAAVDVEPGAVHRQAGAGVATWAMASHFESLLAAGESGGLLGAAIVTQPVGTATPLHLHSREAEVFYLLDGEMTYRAGDDTFEVRPGDFVWLPARIPHAFRVTGVEPVRFLGLSLPGGLFELYDEVGRPAGEARLPTAEEAPLAEDVERWLGLAPSYGLQVLGPPLPPPHDSQRPGEGRPLAPGERKDT